MPAGTDLNRDQIGLIERLFAQGAEPPAIAAAAGCGASTVKRVLAGRHSLQLRGRRDAVSGVRSYRVRPVRCPGCGGLVHELPCRLCLTVNWPVEKAEGKAEACKN
jgi:hypothetical protein